MGKFEVLSVHFNKTDSGLLHIFSVGGIERLNGAGVRRLFFCFVMVQACQITCTIDIKCVMETKLCVIFVVKPSFIHQTFLPRKRKDVQLLYQNCMNGTMLFIYTSGMVSFDCLLCF